MKRAVHKLVIKPALVLVDGNQTIPALDIPQQTIVGGDSSSIARAAASIVAKVWRDDLMTRLAQKYPGVGIEQHKGYGTATHLEALNQFSPTRLHRTSFSPVQAALDKHKDFQLIENSVEESIMSEVTSSTQSQPKQPKTRGIKVRNLSI